MQVEHKNLTFRKKVLVVKYSCPYLCGVNNDKVKHYYTTKMENIFTPQSILERQEVRLQSLMLELADLTLEREQATGNQELTELVQDDIEVVMTEIANLRVDVAELQHVVNKAH